MKVRNWLMLVPPTIFIPPLRALFAQGINTLEELRLSELPDRNDSMDVSLDSLPLVPMVPPQCFLPPKQTIRCPTDALLCHVAAMRRRYFALTLLNMVPDARARARHRTRVSADIGKMREVQA